MHPHTARTSRTPRRTVRGFTLIETSLATVIVGVGVLAMIEAQQAFMKANNWSTQAATATYLANEIREMTRSMPRHDSVTGLYFDEGGNLQGWGPEDGEVSINDFDDLDDFDGLDSNGIWFRNVGTPGIVDGDLRGPIDAFGEIVPEILADGTIQLDEQDNPAPMRGWSQRVLVTKISPHNTSLTAADNEEIAPVGVDPGVPVDDYPLRVTVEVYYQGLYDSTPSLVTSVVWIVP